MAHLFKMLLVDYAPKSALFFKVIILKIIIFVILIVELLSML